MTYKPEPFDLGRPPHLLAKDLIKRIEGRLWDAGIKVDIGGRHIDDVLHLIRQIYDASDYDAIRAAAFESAQQAVKQYAESHCGCATTMAIANKKGQHLWGCLTQSAEGFIEVIAALAGKPAGAEQGNEIQLLDDLHKCRQALAEAAREINCAGPVAHRIRVLKRDFGEEIFKRNEALRLALPILLSNIERLTILYNDFFSVHGDSQDTRECKELLDAAITARDAVAQALGEEEDKQ